MTVKKRAKKQPKTIKIGDIVVPVVKLTREQVKKNILEGQRALARAKNKIITPGVELNFPDDVPMYYADSNNLGQIIRVFKGKKESGIFVKGKFKVIS